jgi:PleD family two-component response regulator
MESDRSGKFHMHDISPEQKRNHDRYRISVVDDDYGTALFFREALQQSGYEVDLYTSPDKVLLEFKSNVYDLLTRYTRPT